VKEQRGLGAEPRDALTRAMDLTGRPIVFTSIVSSLGFSVLVLASFNPVVHFGILASAVVLLAVVSDLVVLPAIVGMLRWSL